MAKNKLDLSGTWRFAYWYPSNNWVGDDESDYPMRARTEGNEIIFESEPNEDGSHMLVQLTLEDTIATGSWHEQTSPNGEFGGAKYNGYGQLVVDYETESMEGKWAGAGFDRKLKTTKIYNGIWTIHRER